jgi:hypothetical protein
MDRVGVPSLMKCGQNTGEIETLIFRRQWCILESNSTCKIVNAQVIPLSEKYCLYVHKDLSVSSEFIKKNGVVVLGLSFYPGNPLANVASSLLENFLSVDDIFLGKIFNLAGSYAIILIHGEEIYLFNDPAGFMGIYFTNNAAASTPSLLPKIERNNLIDNNFKFKQGNDWYTGSITPYKKVNKLIPNFLLKLSDLSTSRFWPIDVDDSDKEQVDFEQSLLQISHLLIQLMEGVEKKGNLLCSLTGGQDTRLVLAASKTIWPKIKSFTLSGPQVQKNDVVYAEKLAAIANIEHKIYQIIQSPQWLLKIYDDISAGESIGARREIAGTCLQFSFNNAIHVNGNLGALFKAYYWPVSNPQHFKVSSVLRDFSSPGEISVNGVNEWIALTPKLSACHLYNLFYLEQRGGRWISAGENASRIFYESFSPFNYRPLFRMITNLPNQLQFSGKLIQTLTRILEPKLLSVPYCKGRRGLTKYIPEAVKLKLRKLIKK